MTSSNALESRTVARWLRILAAVALLSGIFLRFYHLERKVFWEDEILGAVHMFGYTEAEIVAASPQSSDAASLQRYVRPTASQLRPLGATVHSLATEDPQHPPGYYVLGRLWAGLFGSSAAAVRSLPALFGVLVLPCLYWLCLELFDSAETGLIAVILLSLSPFFVLYAQEAREYSLWTALIVLDAIAFLRASRSQALAPWFAYAALTALALYVYPLTGLVTLGFGFYLLVRERGRLTRTFVACVFASVAALVSFTPWVTTMLAGHGLQRGMSGILMQKLTPTAIALTFARDLRFPYFDVGAFRYGPLSSTSVNLALTVFVVALEACAFVTLIRRRPYRVWGFVTIGLCLAMAPLLLEDLLVHGRFVYQARYFIPLLLGAELAVAALFATTMFARTTGAAARRAWTAVFACVLCGEVLSCVVGARADTWWNKDYERSRSVAQIVNVAAKPLVISNYVSPSMLALAYYLDPSVALRLALKCTQCTVASDAAPASIRPSDDQATVFRLELSADPASAGRALWIDPRPFPLRAGPLNMFLSI